MSDAWPAMLAASIDAFTKEARNVSNRLIAFRTLVGTDKFPAAFASTLDAIGYMQDLASRTKVEAAQPQCCWKDAYDGGIEGCKDLQLICEEHVPVASKNVAKKSTKENAKKALTALGKDKTLPRVQERFSNLRIWLERMESDSSHGSHHSH